jgi:hypothetical protein
MALPNVTLFKTTDKKKAANTVISNKNSLWSLAYTGIAGSILLTIQDCIDQSVNRDNNEPAKLAIGLSVIIIILI